MAEIKFNQAYDDMGLLDQKFYDSTFKNTYDPNKSQPMLEGKSGYNQMKAAYEAQQEVPEKSFFGSLFSEASAAEPEQYGLVNTEVASMYTPEMQLAMFGHPNALGTQQYYEGTTVPVATPFSNAANTDFMSQFQTPQAANRYSGMGQTGPNKSDMIGNTIAEAMIDEDRIPGRVQESVPNYQGWFERMMSGAQNKLGGAWGKTKELGSRFKEGAKPVFGLASMIGNATNPLNPKAFNYNPDLAPQLNFMDQQFPGMMTNNPSSGLLQYSDKVMLDGELVNNPLRGQAGMSVFGSNNPIGQLEKQMARHQKTIDNFANQWGKLKEDDIDAYNQKLSIHTNRLKNTKTIHDKLIANKKAREAAAAKAAQAAHDAQMARSGITVSSGGYQGTGDRGRGGQGAFKEDVASMRSAGRSYTDAHGNTGYSRGRKDGGRIGYANGGLASLFTRRG